MAVPIVKRYLNEEEWWPVYELHRITDDSYGTEVQIPEELVNRYAKAYKEFRAVQKILKSFWDEVYDEEED